MLMHCPRCGFSQPEDQYCAQCGVNMQSFRRKEKSLAQKLFANVGLQTAALLVAAGFLGSYLMQNGSSPQWAQKLTRFQSVNKSTKSNLKPMMTAGSSSVSNELQAEPLNDLTEKEISLPPDSAASGADAAVGAVAANLTSSAKAATESATTTIPKSTDVKDANPESPGVLFRLTYAEVSNEVLARWVAESSRLGLFQNLQDYSAGIIPDFKKRGDPVLQYLKTADKKIPLGQTETNLSGRVSDDGLQMIGISVAYDVKSLENNSVHGSVVVTVTNREARLNFPAEFDLPKGAAFFMMDTLTRQSFRTDRATLTMAPFQVLNSIDFSAQKSKFIILLEPDLK